MANEPVGIVIVIFVAFGLMLLADRLGLLRPNRPNGLAWLTCLYFVGSGAVFLLLVNLLQVGLRGLLSDRPILVDSLVIGATAGAMTWFVAFHFNRRRPS